MTREEEIRQEALKWKTNDNEFTTQTAFEAGAKWADEHSKSPWISTKECLPECSVNVLLLVDGNVICVGHLVMLQEGKEWMIFNDRWRELDYVDYWMPIPGFPRGNVRLSTRHNSV